MADNKTAQERAVLHRAIWAVADELRGSIDGWDFKNYVLGTMFYRYISENLTNYINTGERDAGNEEFDYARMSDEDAEEAREGLIEEKGFFMLPSELFCNVRAKAASNDNLNETLVPKTIYSSHRVSSNSSIASCTRSSSLPSKLIAKDSGSTMPSLLNRPGSYFHSSTITSVFASIA